MSAHVVTQGELSARNNETRLHFILQDYRSYDTHSYLSPPSLAPWQWSNMLTACGRPEQIGEEEEEVEKTARFGLLWWFHFPLPIEVFDILKNIMNSHITVTGTLFFFRRPNGNFLVQ